jgi:hypothetical protein
MAKSQLFQDLQNKLRDIRSGMEQLPKEERRELTRQLHKFSSLLRLRRNLLRQSRPQQQDVLGQINRMLQENLDRARGGQSE